VALFTTTLHAIPDAEFRTLDSSCRYDKIAAPSFTRKSELSVPATLTIKWRDLYDGAPSPDYDGSLLTCVPCDVPENLTFAQSAPGEIVVRIDADARAVSFLYCGEHFDADLGLYYLRARLMNPLTGRFWTADSYEGEQEDPATLHKYMYANGDGVNLSDPSGNFSLGELSMAQRIVVFGGVSAAVGAVSGGIIGGYLWALQTDFGSRSNGQTFWQAVGSGALFGAISGAVVGISGATGGPVGVAIAMSVLFGVNLGLSIPVLTDGKTNVETKAAILVLLVIQAKATYGHVPKAPPGTNLANPQRVKHIIWGDETGGGHAFPGNPGKTPFPATWSDAKILTAIAEIVTDPNNAWTPQTGNGGFFTKAGNPARFIVEGTHDGLPVKVIIEPTGEGIITAFPQ